MKNITEINIMSGSYLARKIPFKFVQIRVKLISNSFRIPNSFHFKLAYFLISQKEVHET